VSAVIPVHNGQDFVAEAIGSVLAQTHPALECIVIDDGSTDGTAEVVHVFDDPVTYVYQEQAGVSSARNRGAQLARGELVAFLDHDDVWLPEKLERQVIAIDAQDATLALCAMNVVDRAKTVLGTKRLRPRTELLTGMLTFDGTETVSSSSTGLVRRNAFLALGGFDPHLSQSADWDLLFRVLLEGSIAYVDEPLVLYRMHDSNMSRRIGLMERDMTYAFAKAFRDPKLPPALRRRRRFAYSRLFRMLAGSYRDSGEWSNALRTASLAIGYDPRILGEIALKPTRRSR
jgi:glycosyltransferase involved in cell wall biosynthesis